MVSRRAEERGGGPRDITEDAGDRWLGGVHAVLEALAERPGEVLDLWVADGIAAGTRRSVEEAAGRARVKVKRQARQRLDAALPGITHQGVAARLAEVEYAELEAVVVARPGIIVLLDGVEDPRNLGAILRSAWAFDAGAVVIPKHRAVGLTPAAVKAAAGGAEHVPVVRVANSTRALETLKGAGYWIYGAAGEAEISLTEAKISPPAVLVFGGEGKGIRPAVRGACDVLYRIPMRAGVDSLNVSVAVGVVLSRLYDARPPAEPG
jgi:23S rRNA (guanosine2251-2'-O)-methyltransferase